LSPKSPDYKYVPYDIRKKDNVITFRKQQLSAHRTPRGGLRILTLGIQNFALNECHGSV